MGRASAVGGPDQRGDRTITADKDGKAGRQLDEILGRVKYVGPEPPPSENELMEIVLEEIQAVRATDATTYRIIVEREDDRWRAYCPALESKGASTWGRSREEAVRHIREVLGMIAAERKG